MKILHGTWIPEESSDFVQSSNFYLWAESIATKQVKSSKRKSTEEIANHPYALSEEQLKQLLISELGIKDDLLDDSAKKFAPKDSTKEAIFPRYFLLPTANQKSLPSEDYSAHVCESECGRQTVTQ